MSGYNRSGFLMTTVDPTTAGLKAVISSKAFNRATGMTYVKVGPLDTDWIDANNFFTESSGGGPHASSHEDGGGDELDLTGMSGLLATAQTPAAHGHSQGDVTGLVTDLAGKSAVGHGHIIGDVTSLQSSLDGKAATSHTHAQSDVTGLVSALAGKEATGVAAGLIATHEAASDPHTGYQRESEKGAANGYASLDGGGLVPASQLPPSGGSFLQASRVLLKPGFATANLTSTKSLTSNTSFAVYVGRAPGANPTVNARYRVTTAAATITWAEVAVATGTPAAGSSPSLTIRGFTNVASVVNSTGQKTTQVTTSNIAAGDDIWLVIGCQATTVAVVRAQSIADDLQTGVQASRATNRPSTQSGAQTYTIEGATTLAPWIAAVLP